MSRFQPCGPAYSRAGSQEVLLHAVQGFAVVADQRERHIEQAGASARASSNARATPEFRPFLAAQDPGRAILQRGLLLCHFGVLIWPIMRRKRRVDVLLEPIMLSRPMRSLARVLRTVASKDVLVCLIGESGSGKDVIARYIHELSPRRSQPFAPINCAAIPQALFESELFGHERGAFTGANQLVRGKIEAASGGSLFLDEIGELPMAMQAKFLRFLENRRFTRVGGTKKIDADVRPICATHHSLDEEVRRGTFRADLFYRIQVITLTVPPLRERRADVAPLVEQFLAELTVRHQTAAPRLSRAAMVALRDYQWPGNIRELRNVIEQLCLLRAGKVVRPNDLPSTIQAALSENRSLDAAGSNAFEVRLDRPLEENIDLIIEAALVLEDGNRTRAARRLGIGLRTLQRRLTSSGF